MAIPSLAMIPSGYKDGKVYSVLPNNGDGDFTFSRGSSATRVNQDGLIEDVRQISDVELVTNGSFATDSDWTKGTGTTISGGSANFVSSSTVGLYQDIGTQSGYVKVEFTVTSYTSGTLSVYSGGNQSVATSSLSVNTLGTYTAYVDRNGGNVNIIFGSSDGFTGSIDNVSVKEVLAFDVPRLDYTDGSCPSLLLEPQSTNFITYSEDFSDSSWVKTNSTVVSNSTISPSGSLNSGKLVESSSSSPHGINVNYSSTSSMSFSVFAKAAERTFVQLQAGYVGFTDCVFDLSNGTILIEEANVTGNIEDYGNGWYRCSVSYNSSGLNNPTIKLYNGSDNYQGDGTSGLYIWGAQLEQLSYATSYIPTNGAIATRLADVANNSGNSTLINSTEGVLYAEIAALANDGTFRMISISDGTNNNRIRINYTSTSQQIQSRVVVGGADVAEINKFGFSNITDFTKIALSYKQNEVNLYINGELIGTDTSATMPSANTFNVLNFDGSNGSNDFYGKTKALAVYKEALTDSELQALTTI